MDFISKIDPELFKKFGIILETNIYSDEDNPLTAFSSGWIEIDGETFAYVGKQTTGQDNRYLGTRLHMVRGEEMPFVDEIPKKITTDSNFIKTLIPLLPGLISTRSNFNFAGTNDDNIFALEPTFRVGGATGAELLAREILSRDAKALKVTASTHVIYGENFEIPDGYRLISKSRDQVRGSKTTFARVDKVE